MIFWANTKIAAKKYGKVVQHNVLRWSAKRPTIALGLVISAATVLMPMLSVAALSPIVLIFTLCGLCIDYGNYICYFATKTVIIAMCINFSGAWNLLNVVLFKGFLMAMLLVILFVAFLMFIIGVSVFHSYKSAFRKAALKFRLI